MDGVLREVGDLAAEAKALRSLAPGGVSSARSEAALGEGRPRLSGEGEDHLPPYRTLETGHLCGTLETGHPSVHAPTQDQADEKGPRGPAKGEDTSLPFITQDASLPIPPIANLSSILRCKGGATCVTAQNSARTEEEENFVCWLPFYEVKGWKDDNFDFDAGRASDTFGIRDSAAVDSPCTSDLSPPTPPPASPARTGDTALDDEAVQVFPSHRSTAIVMGTTKSTELAQASSPVHYSEPSTDESMQSEAPKSSVDPTLANLVYAAKQDPSLWQNPTFNFVMSAVVEHVTIKSPATPQKVFRSATPIVTPMLAQVTGIGPGPRKALTRTNIARRGRIADAPLSYGEEDCVQDTETEGPSQRTSMNDAPTRWPTGEYVYDTMQRDVCATPKGGPIFRSKVEFVCAMEQSKYANSVNTMDVPTLPPEVAHTKGMALKRRPK